MVERLRELGVPVTFERVREIAAGDNIVRPHIAQAIVETGVVGTEQEAFDRYIADGRPAHVPKHALDPVDAVGLIRGAGGVCVLAHPGMWGDERSVPEPLIEAMAAAGMSGLEVDHTDHTPRGSSPLPGPGGPPGPRGDRRLGLPRDAVRTDPARDVAVRARRVRTAPRARRTLSGRTGGRRTSRTASPRSIEA